MSDAKWLSETENGEELIIDVPEPGIFIKTKDNIDFIQFIGMEVVEDIEPEK